MRAKPDVYDFLFRTFIRFAILAVLSYGIFTAGDPLSLETVVVWSGAHSLPSGHTVPAGQTMVLDPEADTTLTLSGNLVVQGTLRSEPAPGIEHVIRFTGMDESKFVGGGNEPLASDVGLWVTGAGRLELAGQDKLAWTRSASNLPAGATTATLEAAAAGWKVGDEILITATESPNATGFSTHQEVRVLTSVGAASIGFAPLAHPHPRVTVKPGVSYGAEIVNLTRSVRVEGQDAAHRSHVWVKSSAAQSIRNVAIRFVGPQKGSPADAVLGRYGIHFHKMGDGAQGSLVEGVVVRQTGGPAFAVHASNGVTLRNTVAFDVQSAAYWYDPGAVEAPNDVLYEGALAALVRPTPQQDQGHRLTAFLLGRGNGNGCVRCVASGVQGGKNASGFEWPEGEVGVWRFEDSVAHNNVRDGIFVWQNATTGHFVDRFTAYHNGHAGIEHGAYTNAYHYRDNLLYGNGDAGVALHAESLEAPPPLSFERPYIDGAGITQNAVLLEDPTNLGQPPALWCGASIVGLKGTPFLVNYTGADASVAARLLILADCPVPKEPAPAPPPTIDPSPVSDPRGEDDPRPTPTPGPPEPTPTPPPPSPTASPGRPGVTPTPKPR